MSRDYLIINFNGPLPSRQELDKTDYQSPPLSNYETVKQKISTSLPELKWDEHDARKGYTLNNGDLIEWDLFPQAGPQTEFVGVTPYGVALAESSLARLCRPNNWYVFDGQVLGWIAPDDLREETSRF